MLLGGDPATVHKDLVAKFHWHIPNRALEHRTLHHTLENNSTTYYIAKIDNRTILKCYIFKLLNNVFVDRRVPGPKHSSPGGGRKQSPCKIPRAKCVPC